MTTDWRPPGAVCLRRDLGRDLAPRLRLDLLEPRRRGDPHHLEVLVLQRSQLGPLHEPTLPGFEHPAVQPVHLHPNLHLYLHPYRYLHLYLFLCLYLHLHLYLHPGLLLRDPPGLPL